MEEYPDVVFLKMDCNQENKVFFLLLCLNKEYISNLKFKINLCIDVAIQDSFELWIQIETKKIV